MAAKIEIYTKSYCPYCVRAKMLLDRKGAPYQEIDVENDAAKFEEMLKRSAHRRTVPQIFIDDFHVGGYDDLHVLESAGKLQAMLKL